MRIENLKNCEIKNGKYRHVVYKSDVEPLKGFKHHKIEKITSLVARFGCFYGNVKKQVVSDDELINVESTHKFGEWVEGYVNLISQKISEEETKTYLWLYYTKNRKHRPQTTWLLDGEPTTKQYLIDNGYVSPKNPKVKSKVIDYEQNPMFVVKLENVIKF